MAEKIDFKKEWKYLYNPPRKPVLVEVPPLHCLMIDGAGDPNTSQAYQDAIETLFPLSYALKFAVKKRQGVDYSVLPLEGLWWGTPADQHTFTAVEKRNFQWTSLIVQPEMVTAELYAEVKEKVKASKKPPSIDSVRFETLDEGLCAQIMHIGPFDAEGPTVDLLHAFIHENGYQLSGKHHEIYLSDFRRAAPEKLRTVIRHPICKTG